MVSPHVHIVRIVARPARPLALWRSHWEAAVYVNGRDLGGHRGGYDAFTLDITRALRSGEPQEVVVSVLDPTDESWHLHGKQTLHPGGCSYTACSGIWQTVWLEPVPMTTSIETLHAVPDLQAGVLKLTVAGRVGNEPLTLVAPRLDGETQVAQTAGKAGFDLWAALRENKVHFYKNTGSWFTADVDLPMKDAKRWTPDSPFLYDLKVEMHDKDGKVLDAVGSYFAMRSVGKQPDPKGFTRFLLNGQPTLMTGALDQGFWPDGIYTAATDEALKYDVEIAKYAGLNIIRKHVKVEPDRFYYWCDRLGLMVLQDMPTGKEGDAKTDLPASPEAAAQCELEKRNLIQQRWNHPSIVAWCPFNEGWGQHDTLRYAKWIKDLDPTRLVDEASGFPWHGGGDIQDSHGGTSAPNPHQIGIVSENGGFGVATPGHDWPCEIWTYHSFDPVTGRDIDALGMGLKGKRMPVLSEKSKARFTRAVARMYADLWEQKDSHGMTGQFFCQLYDTESECDGLVSYDRAVWKVDPAIISKAARGGLTLHVPASPAAGTSPTRTLSISLIPTAMEIRERTTTEFRDPAIIRDGDRYYLTFTVFPFSLVGPRKLIEASDNSNVNKKTSLDYLEGPWMIKRNGKYVLSTAAPYRGPKPGDQNSTASDLVPGYWVCAAVADNIWGPFRKQSQVFLGGDIAVFHGPDGKEWFAYRGESGGKAEPCRLCIDPIPFNSDGSVKPFKPTWRRWRVPPGARLPAAGTPFDLQGFINRELHVGKRRIVVPPGRYRVTPHECQHLVLHDLKDVQIVADGVEMICTETTRALTISRCTNVTVRRLVIDYDPLPYTQGRIAAISADRTVYDIELFDGYPAAETAHNFKYEVFRSDTRTLRCEDRGLSKIEVVDSRRLRLTSPGRHDRNPEHAGDLIVIGSEYSPHGSAAHAVECSSNANVRLENIDLFASNCFGFLEYDCDGSVYSHCRIDRRSPADDPVRRASPRLRSLNADAYHSKQAIRGPSYLSCEARFMGDDCINICGDYHLIVSSQGRQLHVLAKGSMNIQPGDPVELVRYTGERLPDARAVSIQPAGRDPR